MAYCNKCGAKVEVGDVFCTNCGTKQVQASTTHENQNQQVIEKNNFNDSNRKGASYEIFKVYNTFKNQVKFSGIGDTLIKMLTKPVSGAKQFVENSERGSVIGMTLILTIIQGFLGVWKIDQVISSMENIAMDFIQKIAGLMNIIEPGASSNILSTNDKVEIAAAINKAKAYIHIPYGSIFFQNSFIFLITIAIIFIIIYFGNNILSKNKIDVFTIYKISLIVLVPILYFEILSIIASYLSFYIGLLVFIIGILVSLECLTIVLKEKLSIDENYCIFMLSILCIVVLTVFITFLQKFVSSNVSDIIMSVTNAMKTLKF